MPSIEGGELDGRAAKSRSSASWPTSSTPCATRRAPRVTGEDGRRALALAQQITDRDGDGKP